MSDLKTASENFQYEIKKMDEKIEQIKSDIVEEKEFASTVRSVAWKTWWVPIAGQVGAVGLALRANAAESFAEQLEKQLSIENNHIIEMNTKDPAELAENYDDYAERIQEDRQKGYEFGLERARAAGISVS